MAHVVNFQEAFDPQTGEKIAHISGVPKGGNWAAFLPQDHKYPLMWELKKDLGNGTFELKAVKNIT